MDPVCVYIKETRSLGQGIHCHHDYARGCAESGRCLYFGINVLVPSSQTVQGIDQWDGYHWMLTSQLAQDGDWTSLKRYMDTMGETYSRESMEHLIQSASLRLYQTYWPTPSCPDGADPP